MTDGSTQARFWDWRFFAIAMLLMAPEASLHRREMAESAFDDTTLPMPGPGQTVIFSVHNPNSSYFVDDKFSMTFSFAGNPKNKDEISSIGNLQCAFYIKETLRGGSAKPPSPLHIDSPFDDINSHRIGFSSNSFNLPSGRNSIELTNYGCKSGYNFKGGMVRIGQYGEHLLIPLGAALLRSIGWILAAMGFGLGLFRYIRARRNS